MVRSAASRPGGPLALRDRFRIRVSDRKLECRDEINGIVTEKRNGVDRNCGKQPDREAPRADDARVSRDRERPTSFVTSPARCPSLVRSVLRTPKLYAIIPEPLDTISP